MTNHVSDAIVLQIIERGISSLGETPEQATWSCLEKDFNLSRQKVPENLEEFEQTLQKLFGPGSNFLDALFRKSLSDETGEDLSNFSTFTKCVAVLREKQRAESRVAESAKDPIIATSKTDNVGLTEKNEATRSPKRKS